MEWTDEIVKRVAVIRHGKKLGGLLTPEQVEEIKNQGIAGLNELLESGQEIAICQGTEFERTAQTIYAFEVYMERRGFVPALVLGPEPRFGSRAVFDEMTDDIDLMEGKGSSSWYPALKKIRPNLLRQIQTEEYQALTEIFQAIHDKDIALVPGHTPMIELLGHHIDNTLDPNLALKELTGIMFAQDRAGRIFVEKMIGF